MPYHFKKHFTLEQARALLPEVRRRLENFATIREELSKLDNQITQAIQAEGNVGGAMANRSVTLISEIQGIFGWFKEQGILIKDPERGLIDFPSIRQGQEVFLCWEMAEEDIEYWHAIEDGYAGRTPL